MPLLQRYDEESSLPITPMEMQFRWIDFHKQIRALSGTRFQRTAGRMLGEDTLRYNVARFIFRPLLRVMRGLKKKEPVMAVKLTATNAVAIFPINYRPRQINYGVDPASLEFDPADVTIVALDQVDVTPADVVVTLNETLNNTTSEWLFLTDASYDDESRYFTVARLLAFADRNVDVVFADEAGANPFAPVLKSPAVGPHTLLSYNVVGRPALLRVETLFAVGGFSPDAGWAFEHDAYLRLNEKGATFRHVMEVLPAGRPARDFDVERLNADTCRVVEAALTRRGWNGTVSPGDLPGVVKWRLAPPATHPSIDIIIPTRDRVDLVRRCIDSIEERSTYDNYDIIILDNDSKKPETLRYFEESKYRVVACPGPFNYAHIVNRGVSHSSADFIVTLNNDTIVVTPDWLEQMVAIAALPDVGIVGACLLDEEGRREHESIVIAPYPQHLRTDTNYFHADAFVAATRDVSAVTGAVQMVERSFWNVLGGMDEQLKVVMNDVDICLRSLMEDRYVVFTPEVQLYHHVGSSRGDLDPIEDRNRFIRRWDIFGTFRDPFFPASLVLLGEKMYYLPRDVGPESTDVAL